MEGKDERGYYADGKLRSGQDQGNEYRGPSTEAIPWSWKHGWTRGQLLYRCGQGAVLPVTAQDGGRFHQKKFVIVALISGYESSKAKKIPGDGSYNPGSYG